MIEERAAGGGEVIASAEMILSVCAVDDTSKSRAKFQLSEGKSCY